MFVVGWSCRLPPLPFSIHLPVPFLLICLSAALASILSGQRFIADLGHKRVSHFCTIFSTKMGSSSHFLPVQLLLFLIIIHLLAITSIGNGQQTDSETAPPTATEKDGEKAAFFLVNTTYGAIRGFRTPISGGNGDEEAADENEPGKSARTFLGVPFARPPINELRFEKPVEPKRWKGVRDAMAMGPACFPMTRPQMWVKESEHSEDCLTINIMSPDWPSADGKPFPVLAFIHGGGFQSGTVLELNPKVIAQKYVREGIVVAFFQYRIGPLGFAATGDEKFAGNYGLWDQVLALKFIRDNIEQFGGDPKRITLWGFSAGSASVSALSVSPHSRDLFRQAIQMSGSMLAEWATSNRPIFSVEKFALEVGCRKLEDSAKLKKCLKDKSVHELLDAMERVGPRTDDLNILMFTPRLDADFFPDDLLYLLEKAPPKRSLIGTTQSEALTFTMLEADSWESSIGVPSKRWASFGRKDFEKSVRELVAPEKAFGPEEAKQVQQRIIDFYLKRDEKEAEEEEEEDNVFHLRKYTELMTDIMFLAPAQQEVRQKAALGWPVFLYQIDYFSRQYFPAHVPVKGSCHAMEMPYVFDLRHVPFPLEQYSEEDLAFARLFVGAICNFVKNGDPSFPEMKWPPLTAEKPLQHALLNTKAVMKKALAADRYQFWQELREEFSFDIIRGIHKVSLRCKDEL